MHSRVEVVRHGFVRFYGDDRELVDNRLRRSPCRTVFKSIVTVANFGCLHPVSRCRGRAHDFYKGEVAYNFGQALLQWCENSGDAGLLTIS